MSTIGIPAPPVEPQPTPAPTPPIQSPPPTPQPPKDGSPPPIPTPVPTGDGSSEDQGSGTTTGGTQTGGKTTAPGPDKPGGKSSNGLPELANLALLIMALALASALKDLNDFFNWIFRTLWNLGFPHRNPPQIPLLPFSQAFSNSLGNSIAGIDADVGLSFQKLATLQGGVGDFLLQIAAYAHASAAAISGVKGTGAALRHEALQARERARNESQAVTDLQTQTQTLRSRTEAQNAAQQAQIDHLTTHVTTVLEPELARLRHLIPALERGSLDAWDLLKQHEEALGASAFTAATALALGRLGADWSTCENNQQLGNALCGPTGSSLARLLRGGLPLLAFGDICLTLKAASGLLQSGAIQDSLKLGADGVQGLMHCAGAEGADALDTAYFQPGPITVWASPGTVTSSV